MRSHPESSLNVDKADHQTLRARRGIGQCEVGSFGEAWAIATLDRLLYDILAAHPPLEF